MESELRISPQMRCQIFLRECLIMKHLLKQVVSDLHVVYLLLGVAREVLLIDDRLVDG